VYKNTRVVAIVANFTAYFSLIKKSKVLINKRLLLLMLKKN
jgi:hypothetical protein